MAIRQPIIKLFGLQFIVSVIILAALVSISGAQQYPERAIDIVSSAAPGGAVDTFFRQIREGLASELKVPVNIVNRTGGVAGTSFVANAKGDGYTLLVQDSMTFVIRQVLMPKTIPYDVFKDFTPIANCAYEPLVLVARPTLECNSLKDLVSYAKQNPAKLLAGTTVGGHNHMNLEILKRSAGINIRHLPLAGGGEILVNLLGGHVDLTFSSRMASRPHVRAGKLRALAVVSDERLAEFPEVMTAKEQGFPEVNLNMNYILLGPKGLSQEIVERLASAMDIVLKSSRAELETRGYVLKFSPPSELRERLAKEFSRYTELAQKLNLVQE